MLKVEPLFVIGCSHRDLDGYLTRHFQVGAGEDAGQCGQMLTLASPRAEPLRVVWVQDRHAFGVLLHEVFHLVTRICHDKGIPIRAFDGRGEWGDEAAAYLYEYVAEAALRRIVRRR